MEHTKYSSKIVADSLSPQGDRLITFVIQLPRIVLAEFNTHRMFSRNSASSRAIPFKKMVKMVMDNPFIPIAWQKDHKGMQGNEYFTEEEVKYNNLKENWLLSRNQALTTSKIINKDGVTKQLCNRLLEPFMWHKVIITSSEEGLMNFFNLRCPQYVMEEVQPNLSKTYYKSWKDLCKDQPQMVNCSIEQRLLGNKSQADVHIQQIAEMMWDSMNESKPKQLKSGDWHVPFGDNINLLKLFISPAIEGARNLCNFTIDGILPARVKIATARCARISYNNFEGKDDYEADLDLYNSLVVRPYTNKKGIEFTKDDPVHASPAEHCARAMTNFEYKSRYLKKENDDTEEGWCRNFKGFIQLRQIQENNI
jgi:thymidylate synthase ThyX